MKINSNFDLLVPNYLFADVARKTNEFAAANPDKEIIRLGIGDVTLPIAPIVVASMKKGCEDLRHKETFKGYPEYEGYDFVREAVSGYYKSYGVEVGADEIFISDGAKSDCGNLGDIFSQDNTVLVTDPVYPVYVDANLMAGRKIIYAAATQENHFLAMPDENVKADIIYLCSPGNPTGAAYSAEQLKIWVDYANKNGAVIIYDAAYEALSRTIRLVLFSVLRARAPALLSFARSQKPQALPEHAAAIPSFPRNLSATDTTCTQCGTAVRRQSSTACRGRFSAQLQRCSAPKDKIKLKRTSTTTAATRRLSRQPLMSLEFTTQAAKIRRTSGLNAPTVWAAGNFSITCSKTPQLSALRARALEKTERAFSA